MNPWFVTGLVDAEGSFSFSVYKNESSRLGWRISPRFNITMSIRDSALLKKIKDFFKVGNYKESEFSCYFDVNSIKDLEIIIEHFYFYPLQSSKRNMFNIFVILINKIKNKEHLNPNGFMLSLAYINILNNKIKQDILNEIIEIYGSLPTFLLPPVPIVINLQIPNPWWIIGFLEGEGCFTYFKRKRITSSGLIKLDYTFVFEISQKTEDIYLLEAINFYFNSEGKIFTEKHGISRFRITNIKSLQHIILPFLTIYQLKGFKKKQFNIWLKAVILVLSTPSWSKERELLLSNVFNELSNIK
jgi:hypothetical protein